VGATLSVALNTTYSTATSRHLPLPLGAYEEDVRRERVGAAECRLHVVDPYAGHAAHGRFVARIEGVLSSA